METRHRLKRWNMNQRLRQGALLVGMVAIIGGPTQVRASQEPTFVVTDLETLEEFTIDSVVTCEVAFGTYVSGGGEGCTTGRAPVSGECGISFTCPIGMSVPDALATTDHFWAHELVQPIVFDMGTPTDSVFVYNAADHLPFPEEGVEWTVWGSDSPDVIDFPQGWTLGTLCAIFKQGWVESGDCPGDDADDFTGLYAWTQPHRYVAVYANFSITIFTDKDHTTWSMSHDDDVNTPGWQSSDAELDAVGQPVGPKPVADAGPDMVVFVGEIVTLDGTGSTGDILRFGWDTDGDDVIDATGPIVDVVYNTPGIVTVTLFVVGECGCGSDTKIVEVVECEPVEDPDIRTQGFWKRVCRGPHRSGEHENLPGYVDCVSAFETFANVGDVDDLCDRLTPNRRNDKCEQAEAQFMALLLNICSGRVATCNCIDDSDFDTVGEAADFIDELLSNPDRTFDDCQLAQAIADDINNGVSLVDCPELPPCEGEPLSCSDLNGDGEVDACDLILLLAAWASCSIIQPTHYAASR